MKSSVAALVVELSTTAFRMAVASATPTYQWMTDAEAGGEISLLVEVDSERAVSRPGKQMADCARPWFCRSNRGSWQLL